MVVKKQLKEYSNRQRIEINKSDKLTTGAEVYILSSDEYNKLIESDKQLQIMKASNDNINQIVKESVNAVSDKYEADIINKDIEIKNLHKELNNLRASFSKILIKLNGLNLFDVIFRKEHKKIIADIQTKIWINSNDDVTAEISTNNGSDDSAK